MADHYFVVSSILSETSAFVSYIKCLSKTMQFKLQKTKNKKTAEIILNEYYTCQQAYDIYFKKSIFYIKMSYDKYVHSNSFALEQALIIFCY